MSLVKSRSLFLACMVAIAGVSSCDNTTTTPGPVVTPDVWGQLAVVKDDSKSISGTDTVITSTETAKAYFYASAQVTTIYQDAGIVSINGRDLAKNSLDVYSLTDNSLDVLNNTSWHVSGTLSIPSITYNYTDTFPDYLPPLPTQIIKSNGLDLQLDSSTVEGADSVRIYIHDGTGSNYFIKSLGAKVGAVNIPASELASLANVSDYSATIGVLPYRGRIKVFGGKGFYFIKERRRYQSINIY